MQSQCVVRSKAEKMRDVLLGSPSYVSGGQLGLGRVATGMMAIGCGKISGQRGLGIHGVRRQQTGHHCLENIQADGAEEKAVKAEGGPSLTAHSSLISQSLCVHNYPWILFQRRLGVRVV